MPRQTIPGQLWLTNHIGYELTGDKQAILMSAETLKFPLSAQLIDKTNGEAVACYPLHSHGKVNGWQMGEFYSIDFSRFNKPGRYCLQLGEVHSHPFVIERGALMRHTFSDMLHYFKSQRCGGIYDAADHSIPLLGSERCADVHGGWYDASGDVSKYLSHLSYANYLNPQQTPMVVWNMLKALALLAPLDSPPPFVRCRLIEEALHGADFLVRMQDPAGYFYMTVFDKWSKDTAQREICAYATQQGNKSAEYQAAFRQGGGIAIAALAAAARLEQHGEFDQTRYLKSARHGYQHLTEHNLAYLPDGEENIIDEYCALLAATELYRSSNEQYYLSEARQWAIRLSKRQQSDAQFSHFWSANSDGSRPYFHATEAGLPLIALCEYLMVEPDAEKKMSIKTTVRSAMSFELQATQKVTNPFGYPRQYVKSVNGEKRDAFFVAQENESGYWWQGENARLGSLACAALLAQPYCREVPGRTELRRYAQNAMNWVVGLNPFDICMLDGHGHNNPDYLPELGFFNAKGGICNGITAGFGDEQGIAFNPSEYKDDMLQNWRWGEQWIPHAAWYLLAVACQFVHYSEKEEE